MKLGRKLNRTTLWVYVLAILLAGSLHAQDITGKWQGTLAIPHGTPLRIVLQFMRDDNGTLKATFYSIDQAPEGYWADSITMQDPTVKFALRFVQASYEGMLSADGNSITGTWIQGSRLQLNFQKATKATAWPLDASPHTVQFVTVETGVKLEVLDWGGTGRPLVFLAGLGNTAHVFDKFAPKFTGKCHVYGITRGGFGDSSAPTPNGYNYSSDRLGDDVLAVIDALSLQKPVLAGHSIAGEELSSIGNIVSGEHKYTEIKAPCLAIFAVPHDPNSDAILPTDPAHHAAAVAADLERTTNLSNAFAAGVPSAQVVRLPNARHDVFNSNEAEVLRPMNDFLDKLPQP
jgi:alpha/beta hydrolase fold